MQKPSIPKGMRDFSANELSRRRYVIDVIRGFFERYGFSPIETPAMERLDVLTGKYGSEGDRLIFKVLNSGDFAGKVPEDVWRTKDSRVLTRYLSEKALRYDLTVPLARYVVMHRNELTFPFKRYQIQPVWRADRPQKGRFREFYQCDADVIGARSLWADVDFLMLYADVFNALGIPVVVRLNNRKVLAGLARVFGLEDRLTAFTVALDKWDKIGREGVEAEMRKAGIENERIEALRVLWDLPSGNEARLDFLGGLLKDDEDGMKGVLELGFVLEHAGKAGLGEAELLLDVTLARGLDYYTGSIFEVVARDVSMGSLGGGGRYDDLTGVFGLKDMSGIGISFGLDRIVLVMEESGLFKHLEKPVPRVMVATLGDAERVFGQGVLRRLRDEGIAAEAYPGEGYKMKKQMQYAAKRGIPFVLIIGEDEMKSGRFSLKNMTEGSQETLDYDEIVRKLKS